MNFRTSLATGEIAVLVRINAQTLELGLKGGAVHPQSLRRAVDAAQLAVT